MKMNGMSWGFFALLGMLALISVSAHAEDAPAVLTATDSSASSPGVLDKIVVKYWGLYSGPSITTPSGYTTDSSGNRNKKPQNLDDLLTAGYQVNPGLRLGVGLPFNLYPAANAGAMTKSVYVGVIDAKLIQAGAFSMHTDFRVYTPIGDMASTQNVRSGFRASQISLYPVSGTPLTLGCYNYTRTWIYGPNGTGYRNDFEFYVSPFANYQLTRTLSATVWSDVVQESHQFGTPWALNNLPMDVQPGVKWDITSRINVNPFLNFIPANLTMNSTAVGMVLNAQLL